MSVEQGPDGMWRDSSNTSSPGWATADQARSNSAMSAADIKAQKEASMAGGERDANIFTSILGKIPYVVAMIIYVVLQFLGGIGGKGTFGKVLLTVFWFLFAGLLITLIFGKVMPTNQESLIFNIVAFIVLIALAWILATWHTKHIMRIGEYYVFILQKCISICLYGAIFLALVNGFFLKWFPPKYEMMACTGIPFAIALVIYTLKMRKAAG